MHHFTSLEVVTKVERITSIGRQNFPFTFLGCPIFYSRKKMDYYQGLISKLLDKLQSWKGKLLSIGGRVVLISHVLQSMPIYLLSVVNPLVMSLTNSISCLHNFIGVVPLEVTVGIGHHGTLYACHVRKVE